MKPLFKGHNASLVNHIFQTLLVTYLILLLAEQIWTGIVSIYLNLNYLLVIVIIAGVLDVFSEHRARKQEKIKKRDYLFIILLGIAGFVIIKFKTQQLGWLSWLISIIAGILIILLSLLVLEEDEEEKEKAKETKEKKFSKLNIILSVLLTLSIVSLILNFFTQVSMLDSLRIVFGSVYVLFLPGFIISFIFFPKTKPFEEKKAEEEKKKKSERKKGSIDWIERVALSFALSIAIVPLAVFYLNLVGVKINILNSFLTILGIIVISLVILRIRLNRLKK